MSCSFMCCCCCCSHFQHISASLFSHLHHRCKESVDFALRCAWLLSGCTAPNKSSKRLTRAQKLRDSILNGTLSSAGTQASAQSSSSVRSNTIFENHKRSSPTEVVMRSPHFNRKTFDERSSYRSKRNSHKRSKSDVPGT